MLSKNSEGQNELLWKDVQNKLDNLEEMDKFLKLYNLIEFKRNKIPNQSKVSIGPKSVRLLEENLEKNLYKICLGKHLLNMTPNANVIKSRIFNQWDCNTLKYLCKAKEIE